MPPVERDLFARRRRALAGAAARQRLRPARRTASRCSSRCRWRARCRSTGRASYGGVDVLTLPTPGHTVGSVTLPRRGRRPAARVHAATSSTAPGKVWSLAATQWTYTRHRGPGGDVRLLRRRSRDQRARPAAARRTASRWTTRRRRSRCSRDAARRSSSTCGSRTVGPRATGCERPFEPVTPHLLRNRTSFAHSYALLSDSGAALLIDCGYDVTTGLPPVTRSEPRAGRCSRRSTRSGATTASSASRWSSRRTTTTTTSPGSTCCATSRAREVWSPDERRAGARASAPLRPAVPVVRPDPASTGGSRSASRSRWHEYELRRPSAARAHA